MKNAKAAIAAASAILVVAGAGASHSDEDQQAQIRGQNVDTSSWAFSSMAAYQTASFERLELEIVEAEPWENPIKKDIPLSDGELIEILRKAGFSGDGLRMAWAIVKMESSKRPYAHNQNSSTGDNSYGLFQINMIGSLGPARLEKYNLESNEDLFEPLTNAEVAYKISSGGKSWGAWTTRSKALAIVNQFPG